MAGLVFIAVGLIKKISRGKYDFKGSHVFSNFLICSGIQREVHGSWKFVAFDKVSAWKRSG